MSRSTCHTSGRTTLLPLVPLLLASTALAGDPAKPVLPVFPPDVEGQFAALRIGLRSA